jgi:hypothetical protein
LFTVARRSEIVFEPRAFSASGPNKEHFEGCDCAIEQMLESIEVEAGEQSSTTKCRFAQEMLGLVSVP